MQNHADPSTMAQPPAAALAPAAPAAASMSEKQNIFLDLAYNFSLEVENTSIIALLVSKRRLVSLLRLLRIKVAKIVPEPSKIEPWGLQNRARRLARHHF